MFDWEKNAAKGPSAWIAALSATTGGVLVAGGEAVQRHQSHPFVASFTHDGRERFRIKLDNTPSTTKPPRAAAVAVASTKSGSVYVLSAAAQVDAPTRVQLTALDDGGKQRFTTPLEMSGQARPGLLADAEGNAIAVGVAPSGDELRIVKYGSDGVRVWSKRYAYTGDIPLATEGGGRLVLAASFHGAARFGNEAVHQHGTVQMPCEGAARGCEEPSRALLVAEFNELGEPVRVRSFGTPASVFVPSDLAMLPDGGVAVTGEFRGPRTALGALSICELEQGMPSAETPLFRELGGGDGPLCPCRSNRRDLFVLRLSQSGEPVWVKTLAVGGHQPKLGVTSSGTLTWAAQIGNPDAKAEDELPTRFSLWTLDDAGAARDRRSASAIVERFAMGDDAAYVSDGKTLRKIRSEPRKN